MASKRLTVVSVLLVFACKQPTASEQMDSIVSWLGTAGMAGHAWLNHTTPDKYTRQTLELSRTSLLQIRRQLFKSFPAGVDGASTDNTIKRSSGHLAFMAKLVEQKNSPDFRSLLDSLEADEKIIKQLADSVEAHEK